MEKLQASQLKEKIKPNSKAIDIDASTLDPILDRFDKIRFNKGDSSTGEVRTSMQKVMQEKCAVFRTEKTLKEGVDQIRNLMREWTIFQSKISFII